MNDDRPVYLDHNATTPVDPAVVDAMEPYLRTHFGNPSSRHVYGDKAREAVDVARNRVADFIGANPDEIIFVSATIPPISSLPRSNTPPSLNRAPVSKKMAGTSTEFPYKTAVASTSTP